ncbi:MULTISPECIES: tautomerase family protein [Halomonas]|jgi:phenylpyruvate tautomerase PptA (4-oxalocrotonate tautomerase family)|uniref:Tautomerase family protein n=2 Tax=Halomonas TaxID=2745 RepID=A0AAU7KXX0_9GAMM|nr:MULTISPECIES: tautomerase family protein [Halomonas]MBR9772282.1 tautomerase family protein [Gammaproteobacteria bacterium]KJZ18187.1 4-oxalocrotonate tautomerase [Halomonas sp. S2151]MBY5941536.1 tautomerase family protein [Halomonas sp. DP5N14-9]MCO7216914.1 tautomerase family protein [Halomonas sp. OfavH-34-E]PTL93666.1 tautomerase family protein [Halomonas sp. SYSU XM8]
MPFVTINLVKGKSRDYVRAVADQVNAAVIDTMGFPDDDRYQVINECEPENLQLQRRDSDRVMMHLVMRSGRPDADKKAFYARVVESLAENPGIPPHNVMITITENQDIDWSFRDGVAQFCET